MKEWKDIAGYEGVYQVSNTGEVRSLPHYDNRKHLYQGIELKLSERGDGYIRVHLSKGATAKWFSVHRLVAEAFCVKPDGCNVVNHIDCNPKNNHAENLEWTTYKGNMEWAAKLGRMKANKQTYINIANGREKRKTPVIATDADGNTFLFSSQSEATKVLGIKHSHIAAACRKEYGYKTVKGYSFRYADAKRNEQAKPHKIGMSKEQKAEETRKRMLGNKLMVGRSIPPEQREKISIALSKPVLQLSKKGELISEYPSASFIRKNLGLVIDSCLSGKTKTAGGYIWKYKYEA